MVLLIEVPFYVLTAYKFRSEANMWSLAVIIGYAIIFVSVILLNSMAFLRVTQIKRTQSCTIIHAEQNTEAIRIQRLMSRIQKCAAQLIVAALGALVLGSLFYVRSQREFYTDPRCYLDSIDIAFRTSMMFVLYGCAVAIWFVAPCAQICPSSKTKFHSSQIRQRNPTEIGNRSIVGKDGSTRIHAGARVESGKG